MRRPTWQLTAIVITLVSGSALGAEEKNVAVVSSVTGGTCEVCPRDSEAERQLTTGSKLKASDTLRCHGKAVLTATYLENNRSFHISGSGCTAVGFPGGAEGEDVQRPRMGAAHSS